MINLDSFVADRVTRRSESLFHADLVAHEAALSDGIEGRSVLVVGGGGTIGSAFIGELLKYRPRSLCVVDHSENGLTELTRNLRSSATSFIPDEFVTYAIDVGSPTFAKLLRTRGPFDIVANFAAHKHVRSEKDALSVEAMILNNVVNGQRLLELMLDAPPERFFCVSTDKAANPTSIMGATKKIMEDMVLAYSDDLRVATARFANVAFSNGSLPDGFLSRISKRQAISAPEGIRRYFVSAEESGQLCLIACVLGVSGDIFFPKLLPETMMTFTDIAEQLLELHGFRPVRCSSAAEARELAQQLTESSSEYPVFFEPSDTSGEKAFEEFFTSSEAITLDRFNSLGVIPRSDVRPVGDFAEFVDRFRVCADSAPDDKQAFVNLLRDYVPTFNHRETGRRLDDKM